MIEATKNRRLNIFIHKNGYKEYDHQKMFCQYTSWVNKHIKEYCNKNEICRIVNHDDFDEYLLTA